MTAPLTAPFDPGLQPERTALAWRRTALAVAVGVLAAWRILASVCDCSLPLALGAAGLVAAGGLAVGAERRRREVHRRLTGPSPEPLGGGGLPFVCTLCALLPAVAGLAFVLTR
ncbi:DUF202 domain-containing protein [Pseudonocardia alni]|uniref:DUF202 domain-containing protein n=1 Tax=Pseudonocardia alni TaxID=33907 RepID=UPI0033228552